MATVRTRLVAMTETWLPVVGYEGIYEVSDTGLVRSLSDRYGRVRVLRPGVLTWGHRQVTLTKDGLRKKFYVHRLVMEAFVGPCPHGQQVRHRNGDPGDNSLSNLRYGTPGENQRDSFEHGTHWSLRIDRCSKGHPFSGRVNRKDRRGERICRTCRAENSARYRAKGG